MKIVVLSALGNEVASSCLGSMLRTSAADFDLYLVREKDFRERTLNFALSLAGTDDDTLFVGDDIEFTPGWYEALVANYDQGDILGLSTLYPGTAKVQDRGYDLVQVDERITLEAKDRGLPKDNVEPFGVRTCDGLCGCFMLVKADVFNLVPGFSEEGQNRWGEFIFMTQARQSGAKVAVIDHYLYHSGKSTKSNPNKALSSISYMAERGIWEGIVSKYVDKALIKFKYHSVITDVLSHTLAAADNILLYGAGTVSEIIIRYLENKRIVVCSGLPEEQGMPFHGYVVENYAKALDRHYDLIVMTPLEVGISLYKRYVAPELQGKASTPAIAIESRIEGNKYVYGEQRIA